MRTTILILCLVPVAAAMERELDVPYATIEGVDPVYLSLDLYLPEKPENAPVMVMIHGGGWRIGDKSNVAVGVSKGKFFTSLGYVYASINYRLSPAVKHPAHVEDVASALAWIHDHIAERGGDPNRIHVMGHSAGAHLAALVATDETRLAAHEKSLDIIKSVILLDGAAYDIPASMKDVTMGKWLAATYRMAFGETEETWRDASPRWHVAPDKGIARFLIVHAGHRVMSKKRARSLAAALEEAGAVARVFHAEDDTHSSVNREIGQENDEVTAQIQEFLADW